MTLLQKPIFYHEVHEVKNCCKLFYINNLSLILFFHLTGRLRAVFRSLRGLIGFCSGIINNTSIVYYHRL